MNDRITAFARLAERARNRIEEISPQELLRARPLPVIIDVRESDEYAEGYVASAKDGLSTGAFAPGRVAELVRVRRRAGNFQPISQAISAPSTRCEGSRT